jgi:hypothetical protein
VVSRSRSSRHRRAAKDPAGPKRVVGKGSEATTQKTFDYETHLVKPLEASSGGPEQTGRRHRESRHALLTLAPYYPIPGFLSICPFCH